MVARYLRRKEKSCVSPEQIKVVRLHFAELSLKCPRIRVCGVHAQCPKSCRNHGYRWP